VIVPTERPMVSYSDAVHVGLALVVVAGSLDTGMGVDAACLPVA